MKNLGQMMKQVQELQVRMQEMQAKLAELELVGHSGGGMVQVTLNGKGVMTGLAIDPGLLKAEEKEVLEDLVVAAHAEARRKMEETLAEKLKDLTGGLPLPPGFSMGL